MLVLAQGRDGTSDPCPGLTSAADASVPRSGLHLNAKAAGADLAVESGMLREQHNAWCARSARDTAFADTENRGSGRQSRAPIAVLPRFAGRTTCW